MREMKEKEIALGKKFMNILCSKEHFGIQFLEVFPSLKSPKIILSPIETRLKGLELKSFIGFWINLLTIQNIQYIPLTYTIRSQYGEGHLGGKVD